MWIKRLRFSREQKEATVDFPSRSGLIRKFLGGKRGSISVEFGLLVPIFLLLVFGIVDFGHALYMKMEITSASREGARYGTRYQGPGKTPSGLVPSITSWVTTNYGPLLPSDANLTVDPRGPGYASGTTGQDLIVEVRATKNWFVIDNFIPGLGSSMTMSSTTYMKVE